MTLVYLDLCAGYIKTADTFHTVDRALRRILFAALTVPDDISGCHNIEEDEAHNAEPHSGIGRELCEILCNGCCRRKNTC